MVHPRRTLTGVIAVLALGALAPAAAHGTLTGSAVDKIADGPQTITFTSFQYTPNDLAVSPGTTTWSGAFSSHPLRFDDGSPGASSGTAAAFTLTPGVVRYYCGLHGGRAGVGMSGTVYVVGPDAALAATPAQPAAAGPVTLDASATDFVDTTPNTTATYAFDADGDGTFETTGASPTTQADFPLDGRTDDATVTVRVGATPAPPSPGGGSGGTGGPGGTTGPATTGGDPADRVAPVLRATASPGVRRGALLRGPVSLRLGTLSERAAVTGSLQLRGRRVGVATAKTVGAGDLRVTIRLTRAGRRAVRAARPATLTLRLQLTDAAGNRRVLTRSVRLRR